MHCSLVQSRSLRKQKKKKILQVPPVTSFLNTSCTFGSNSKQKQEPRDLTSDQGARQVGGLRSGGQSALAGKFYQAPALPASRGWVHAQAFSYLHPMGAPQPHKGEEPVTLQEQHTSPCRGGGYHRVGGERRDAERKLQNTQSTRRRRREKPQPRGDPLPLGASIPIGITTPTLTAALSARFCAPSAGSLDQ